MAHKAEPDWLRKVFDQIDGEAEKAAEARTTLLRARAREKGAARRRVGGTCTVVSHGYTGRSHSSTCRNSEHEAAPEPPPPEHTAPELGLAPSAAVERPVIPASGCITLPIESIIALATERAERKLLEASVVKQRRAPLSPERRAIALLALEKARARRAEIAAEKAAAKAAGKPTASKPTAGKPTEPAKLETQPGKPPEPEPAEPAKPAKPPTPAKASMYAPEPMKPPVNSPLRRAIGTSDLRAGARPRSPTDWKRRTMAW